jgi:hypothetical protein
MFKTVKLFDIFAIPSVVFILTAFCVSSCMLFDIDGHQVPQQTVIEVGETFKRILEEVRCIVIIIFTIRTTIMWFDVSQ